MKYLALLLLLTGMLFAQETATANPDGESVSLHISPAVNYVGKVSTEKDPLWSYDVLLKIPASDRFTLSLFYSYCKFEQEAKMPDYAGYYFKYTEPIKLNYTFNKWVQHLVSILVIKHTN